MRCPLTQSPAAARKRSTAPRPGIVARRFECSPHAANRRRATSFGVAAATAFGLGGTGLALAAPPLAIAAAGGALTYGGGKAIAKYNRGQLKALHQDAMAGRIGRHTAGQLNTEARDRGYPSGRAYLDHLMLRQDLRYATSRLLINLKRETRSAPGWETSGDIDGHIAARMRRLPDELSDDPLGIYKIDNPMLQQQNRQRIEASPSAQFLINLGLPPEEVLALADSADDHPTNEACRQIIQTQLRVAG